MGTSGKTLFYPRAGKVSPAVRIRESKGSLL